MDFCSFFQGIFLIQVSNLHCICVSCIASRFFTTDQPGKSSCFISASRNSLLSLSCLPLSMVVCGPHSSTLLPEFTRPLFLYDGSNCCDNIRTWEDCAFLYDVLLFQGLCSSFLWTGQHACQGDAFNILSTFPSSNI